MPEKSVEDLKAEALSIGLKTDSEIRDYVLKEQNYLREERIRDRAIKQSEREAEFRIRESEAKERELAAQLALVQAQAAGGLRPDAPTLKPAPIRLPFFQEGDDINSFLSRFEKIADILRIPSSDRSAHLGSVLTGRALNIFVSLSSEITSDYNQLKKELLLGFNKTPETYRVEFRNLRIGEDETFSQFVSRLRRCFDRWLEASNVTHTFEELLEFVLCDQFLASVPGELRTFLKEQGPSSLKDMTLRAQSWASAHKLSFKSKEPKPPASPTASKVGSENNDKTKDVTPFQRDNRSIQCYHCKEFGHTKPSCPVLKNLPVKKVLNVCEDDAVHVGFSFDDNHPRKYFVDGTINGQHVSTIWRDTGCNSVIVSRSLIPNLDPSHCKSKTVYDYLGNANTFPVCKVYLKCSLYDGFVDAVVAPLKFCAVLLGNVSGVYDVMADGATQVAQTRSRCRDAVHPLVVPSLDVLNLTPTEFRDLQSSCKTLSSCRKLATSGEVTNFKTRSFVFLYEDGVLYRKCVSSPIANELNQRSLVIPVQCRSKILTTAHESTLVGHLSSRKTQWKIKSDFFWPGMFQDIRRFCQSCDLCKRMGPKVGKALVANMPIISEPFDRVSIDLGSPISPPSFQGHKYAWAYKYKDGHLLVYLPRKDNVGADLLSRSPQFG